MTTPIDDMLTNLIEKLHAARFEDSPPTNTDLHEIAIALADTRLQIRGLSAPYPDDSVSRVADDMREVDAQRSIPVTAEQIATSTGDDLDERAEALGLSRKGWPYHRPLETDDALRTRCASVLFGQTMTRELAEEVAKAALVARIGPRIDSETHHLPIASWVIDAVMSAAGAQPNGRPVTWRTGDCTDELTETLGYAPGSISWPRALVLVRETIDQRNAANAAREALRSALQRATGTGGQWREAMMDLRYKHDAAERTVVDQAAQITALRAKVKRLIEFDGMKMTDAEVAALTGAT